MRTISWLTGLLARRRSRLLGSAFGVAIAVSLVASIGAFLAGSTQAMTERAIARVPLDWQVQASTGTDAAAFQKIVSSFPAVRTALPVSYAQTAGYSASANGTTNTASSGLAIGLPDGYRATYPGEIRQYIGATRGVLLAQQMAANLGVPVVLLDTCTPAQGHAQIVFDNRRAGADMTRWLQAHGHRRIGLILYREEVHHPALEARYQGYQDALRDAGRALDSDLVRRVPPAEQHAALEAALTDLLALPEPPTAMIASNDLMAVEIIEILSSRGVPVPAGVAVAGFDNLAVARRYRPAFPTTAPDFEQMGEIACQTLLDSLAAGTRPVQTYILSVPLLIRSYPARHMPDTDHKTKTDGALHHLSVTA